MSAMHIIGMICLFSVAIDAWLCRMRKSAVVIALCTVSVAILEYFFVTQAAVFLELIGLGFAIYVIVKTKKLVLWKS